MPLAAVPDAVAAAPIAFIVGVLAGFVLANRYRLTKRSNGEPGP